jgi:ubiquinone/menaquinone biosynthesis C-methylase UbiE
VGYGDREEEYLRSGLRDSMNMLSILQKTEFTVTNTSKVLDFGCAAGRMLRHVQIAYPATECWGVDIDTSRIGWCAHNLTPPMHFLATTGNPVLPFPNAYFDLVYAGSVFTHITDNVEAWLAELVRISKPSGRLYITVHDAHTVELLQSFPELWLARVTSADAEFKANRDGFERLVAKGEEDPQVFYTRDYLRKLIPQNAEWLAYETEAYFIQSAFVLSKRH